MLVHILAKYKLTMSCRHKLTLISNAAAAVNEDWPVNRPPVNNSPANFVSDLPCDIAKEEEQWRVSLDRIFFHPIFVNTPAFEPGVPHLIAFNCSNLIPPEGQPLPSERQIRFWYSVQEKRLDADDPFDSVGDLIGHLNNLFHWPWHGEPCLKFFEGKRGIAIEGDGQVALLISEQVAAWLRIPTFDAEMRFGSTDYILLDFSKGRSERVEGFFRKHTLFSVQEPALIKVYGSFDVGCWTERCLAVLPYSVPKTNGAAPGHYHINREVREFVSLGTNKNLRRVKIILRDENGNQLRLAKNRAATIVNLSIKGYSPKMNNFIVRCEGGYINGTDRPESEFRIFFDPPLRNQVGRWEVALHTVYFPAAVRVFEEQDPGTSMEFHLSGGRVLTLPPVPREYFFAADNAMTYITEAVANITENAVRIGLNESGHVQVFVQPGDKIVMGRKLAVYLGLAGPSCDLSTPRVITWHITASEKPDFKRLLPPCIAVHCSAVKKTIFGNKLDDVLDTIPTHDCNGRFVSYVSPRLNYVPVRNDHIANFLMSLKTVDGKPIQFNAGGDKVHIDLLFRENK